MAKANKTTPAKKPSEPTSTPTSTSIGTPNANTKTNANPREMKQSTVVSNPKEHSPKTSHIEYEFGGPIGTFCVIVFLPILTMALFFLCNKDTCVHNPMTFDWNKWISTR